MPQSCPFFPRVAQKLPNFGNVAQMLPAKRLARGHPQCEYRRLKIFEFSACYVCSDIITGQELLDNITIINKLCQFKVNQSALHHHNSTKASTKSKDMLHEHAPYSSGLSK